MRCVVYSGVIMMYGGRRPSFKFPDLDAADHQCEGLTMSGEQCTKGGTWDCPKCHGRFCEAHGIEADYNGPELTQRILEREYQKARDRQETNAPETWVGPCCPACSDYELPKHRKGVKVANRIGAS